MLQHFRAENWETSGNFTDDSKYQDAIAETRYAHFGWGTVIEKGLNLWPVFNCALLKLKFSDMFSSLKHHSLLQREQHQLFWATVFWIIFYEHKEIFCPIAVAFHSRIALSKLFPDDYIEDNNRTRKEEINFQTMIMVTKMK